MNQCDSEFTSTNQKAPCACRWRWTIFSDNLQLARIEIANDHGNSFVPGTDKIRIPPLIKQLIREETDERTLPAAIYQQIQKQADKLGLSPANCFRPTKEKVVDFRKNYIRHQRGGDPDWIASWKLLGNPENSDFILLPTDASTVPDADSDWMIVLIHPYILEDFLLFETRNILGLDAVYKWTKYRLPVYQLAFADALGEGRPIAYCIMQNDTAENVTKFLVSFRSLLESLIPNLPPPFVMIDHDDKELAAVRAVGWFPFFVNFTWFVPSANDLNCFTWMKNNRHYFGHTSNMFKGVSLWMP